MMIDSGKEVFGSDISESMIIEDLRKIGAQIKLGQGMELLPEGLDLIVYSIAISKYDPKFFKMLQGFNIALQSYPEMLGIITDGKYTVAVSGTHGKTTTTAMISKILIDAKKDPSVIVGSLLKDSKSNLVLGESDLFIVEACEYERSFLNIKPKILVITNVESDHLDYYKDLADIEAAFHEMAIQTDNFIICNPSDPSTANLLTKKYKAEIVDYSKYLEKVPKLSVPGLHNRMDAAAALAVANILNIKEDDLK